MLTASHPWFISKTFAGFFHITAVNADLNRISKGLRPEKWSIEDSRLQIKINDTRYKSVFFLVS